MVLLALALALQACPQRIVVTAPSYRSTTATLSFYECGRRTLGPYPARVGLRGLSPDRHEGDDTTPLGTFAIGPTAYGLDPDPGTPLAYHRLRCGDWWDDDPTSPRYNTFEHVPCGTRPPFGGDSEALWLVRVAYRELVVIDFNTSPVVPGRGSGIFLHASNGHATNGCVSIPRSDLLGLLRRLRPGARITIRVM